MSIGRGGLEHINEHFETEYHQLRMLRGEVHKSKRHAESVAEAIREFDHVPDEHARTYDGIAIGLMQWVDWMDARMDAIEEISC